MNGTPRQTSTATTEKKACRGSPSQICGACDDPGGPQQVVHHAELRVEQPEPERGADRGRDHPRHEEREAQHAAEPPRPVQQQREPEPEQEMQRDGRAAVKASETRSECQKSGSSSARR